MAADWSFVGFKQTRIARRISASIRSDAERGQCALFVDLASVTFFFAKERLTFRRTGSEDYVIDATISDLEQKLDPERFVRIHRSTLLNVSYVDEVGSWFGGGMIVRLKNGKRIQLQVARDRARMPKTAWISDEGLTAGQASSDSRRRFRRTSKNPGQRGSKIGGKAGGKIGGKRA